MKESVTFFRLVMNCGHDYLILIVKLLWMPESLTGSELRLLQPCGQSNANVNCVKGVSSVGPQGFKEGQQGQKFSSKLWPITG